MKSEVKIKTTFINIFFSNMPQKFPSQQYVASLHFSSGNFCLPFSFGNPLLLPGVGQHCGQHMQLTICSIQTPSTHFTHRSPSRNLKSFSIGDETGNEQGFQYQRQTIISADHYILAWKKLLNWEFCLQRSCTNAVAGGTRGLIFANVDRSQW